jgi:hypothetical protein
MFEHGFDQAAGLRGEPPRAGAGLMPVACPAQPARAYEMLCTLAAHLTALGREAVIVDGSAPEASDRRSGHDGSHLGLLHAGVLAFTFGFHPDVPALAQGVQVHHAATAGADHFDAEPAPDLGKADDLGL